MRAQSIWILRNRANLRVVTVRFEGLVEYKYLSVADLSGASHVIVDRPGVGLGVAAVASCEPVQPEHLYVDFEYKFVIGKIAYLSDEVRGRHDREVQEIEDETEDQELARLDAAFGAQGEDAARAKLTPEPPPVRTWAWVESEYATGKRTGRAGCWRKDEENVVTIVALEKYDEFGPGRVRRAGFLRLIEDLFASVGEAVARARFLDESPESPAWTWAVGKTSKTWPGSWRRGDGVFVWADSLTDYDTGNFTEHSREIVLDLFSSVGEDAARAKFAPGPPTWVEI